MYISDTGNLVRTAIFLEFGNCVDKLASKNIRIAVDNEVNLAVIIPTYEQMERLIVEKIENYEFGNIN